MVECGWVWYGVVSCGEVCFKDSLFLTALLDITCSFSLSCKHQSTFSPRQLSSVRTFSPSLSSVRDDISSRCPLREYYWDLEESQGNVAVLNTACSSSPGLVSLTRDSIPAKCSCLISISLNHT